MKWLSLLLLLCLPASAQMNTGMDKAVTAAAGAYSGPGDVVSGAAGWWGLRAYSAAKAGTKAANVCDTATGLTCSDVSTGSNGQFPSQASISQCSVSCNIATLYDQSGNGNDFTQATNGNRPTITFNCQNSQPCMAFNGTPNLGGSPGDVTQPWTMSSMAERTGNTGNFTSVYGSGGSWGQLWSNSANTIATWAGSVLSTSQTDNVFHALQSLGNGGSSIINVDGTGTSGAAGANTLTGAGSTIGGGFGNMTGNLGEVGIWSGDKSGSFTSLCHNQRLFWGTGGSC